MRDPLGLDCLAPRLSWKNVAKDESLKNLRQSAYQIEVMQKQPNGAVPVWDSGKIASEQSLNIAYGGKALEDSGRYTWRVRTWTKLEDEPSEWSAEAHWMMGLLGNASWKAKWIGAHPKTRPDFDMAGATWIYGTNAATPYFKKHFLAPENTAARPVILALTGDEKYEVKLNGVLVAKTWGHVNNPKQIRLIEITRFLKAGENIIEASVSNAKGRPAGLAACVRFADGSSLVTDASWGEVAKVSPLDETSFGKIERRVEAVSPAFEKKFSAKKDLAYATLHITGLGFYEASLNGKRIGKKVLDPVPTKFDKRVLYSTYDVTSEVQAGKNALKVLLGHGWYDVRAVAVWNFDNAPWRDFPRMIAQLEMVYKDGSIERVVSDKSWTQVPSPVGFDCIREGEVIGKQRDETMDLSKETFQAEEVPAPAGKLEAAAIPPSVITNELKPQLIKKINDTSWGITFPRNIAGWVRLQLRNQKKGDVVTIRYAERQAEDGRVITHSNDMHFRYPASFHVLQGGSFQVDRFVCDGSTHQVYEPRFTYNGFQYVEINGLREAPTEKDILACEIQTDFADAGSFETSHELINKMQTAILSSYRGNYTNGFPTDCPHREKNGWTGDAHLAAELAMYNFQNTAAYEKWIQDIIDEQRPDGNIPAIIPTSGWGYDWGNGPAWDSALVIIPWMLYVYQGDVAVLNRAYPAIVKYVEYMSSKAKDGILSHGLGDWIPVNSVTPVEVTSTGYYFLDVQILARMAEVLGKKEDAEKYAALAGKIREAFHAHIYKGEGVYSIGSQTAQSCALHQGLVPSSEREKVEAKLIETVEKNQAYPDFGILGSKYIFRTLSEAGRNDLAFAMATKDDKDSYGSWIRAGASTFWEDWKGEQSRNHIMFGDISAWWYQHLGGIRLASSVSAIATTNDPSQIAFKHFIIAPEPVKGLEWVKAKHDSAYGEIHSAWKKEETLFRLEIRVPVNTTATICLPCASDTKDVNFPDAKKAEPSGSRMTYTVGSGNYVAEIPIKSLLEK